MVTLTQLEYVLAVDQHRHFARAASACHVTQPTLSMQLQKLEEELGGEVFDRSRKPLVPTRAGKAIIAQARRVLDERDQLLHLSEEQKGLIGSLRIGVIPTLSSYLLPRFLPDFCRSHEGIRLNVAEEKTESLVRRVEDEELDAAVCASPVASQELRQLHLFYEPFYVYSHPNEGFKRTLKGASELDASRLWVLDAGHCLRDQVLKMCREDETPTPLSNLRFQGENLETLKNLVRSFGGSTLLPSLSKSFLFGAKEQSFVKEFVRPRPCRQIVLLIKRKQMNRRIIEEFKAELLNSLRDEDILFSKEGLKVV